MKKIFKNNNVHQQLNVLKVIFILFFFCYIPSSFSQKIAAGWSHNLYICNNGSSINSWGANASGQVGDASTVGRVLPASVEGVTKINAVATGYHHSFAIAKNDSTLWAWGDNSYGQLGDGTTTNKIIPVKIAGLSQLIAVSGGTAGYHSLALKLDGTVWAWGKNNEGQAGDGSLADILVPTQITTLTGITAIAGGEYHSLALKNDGTVWAWGRNSDGQLGDGTNANSPLPVQVTGLTNVIAIAGGRYFSIALKNDGTVWTWGQNTYGQLGNNTITSSPTPVQVSSLTNVVAVAGGAFHCLSVQNDGTMRAWGRNGNGQLGDGTIVSSSVPVLVQNLSGVTEIAAGTNYSIALKSNDSLFAWGRNPDGQLGDGSLTDKNIPTAVVSLCKNASTQNFSPKIAAGWSHSLYLCNNSVNAWGANAEGQVGDNTTTERLLPTQVSSLTVVKAIIAGYQHSLALKTDSTLWAWGDNSDGQLGDGTTVDKTTPVEISSVGKVIAVSGGQAGYHSLALKLDGTVWAWGRNTDGQLGDGTVINKNVPTQVTGLSGVVAIAGGEYHSLAIKNDGTVWAWGKNSKGQLGNNTIINSNVPVQVNNLTGIKAIAAGRFFSMALKKDSTVWTWGENLYGQLGDGTVVDKHVPIKVTTLTHVTAITGGAFHTLAIKKDSTLVSWGRNTYGNLGNGTVTNSSTPTVVSSITKVVAIAAGTNYSVALKNNNAMYAFGRNANGQLGDGTITDRHIPTIVTSLCVGCTGSVNVSVTQSASGNVLTAAASGATYKWLDCNNSNAVITGETSNSFTATTNGSYAVSVTQNGCTDTSSCFVVNTVGIANTLPTTELEILVYPNPSNGIFNVQLSKSISKNKSEIEIYNFLGEKIHNIITVVNDEKLVINLSAHSNGVYYISAKSEDNTHYQKLIKQ